MTHPHMPQRQGLYDPRFEHDACGVGFVCNIHGNKSHDLVQKGLQVLVNLTHRGAAGSDPETGDGAGILLQIPHAFLESQCRGLGIRLPEPGEYGVAMVFLPRDTERRAECVRILEEIVEEEGQRALGWRDVPVRPDALGHTAREARPEIRQFFILSGSDLPGSGEERVDAFERKLWVIRMRTEHELRRRGMGEFHVVSCSSRTLCYKGLLLAHQTKVFYPDLADPTLTTAIAVVHQRYSTNTWPTWDLAQPFRTLCHNGEINTVRGNLNWMHAREGLMKSELFGDDLRRVLPILIDGGSDSKVFDNALEFLMLAGRPLPHAMMMLIPEAWEKDRLMPDEKRAFYEYHASLMEPWDGPASMVFTDGRCVGAVLDRNGLRPSRYWVTKDGLVVMASEAGVLPIDPEQVQSKGRLQPGRMFLIDTERGRIVSDEELKSDFAGRQPYRRWLDENLVRLEHLPEQSVDAPDASARDERGRFTRQLLFDYSLEDIRVLIAPMLNTGMEAMGSMGNDTPLACLSDQPSLLYAYFKQMFAQVTNPAIDSTREDSVMSLRTTVGTERNVLAETPEHARLLAFDQPVLTNEDLERVRRIDHPHLRTRTLPMLLSARGEAEAALEAGLRRLCDDAANAVREGSNILILSDRKAGADHVPIPALLATSAVHHHLIREGLRMRCGLVIESGEPREVAHFALLIGYGAAAINPYLAFESIDELVEDGSFVRADLGLEAAHENYIKAVGKGLLKIFAKMGISTLASYRGAQIFEAVGIQESVVERYFTGTASRIGGVGLATLAREARMRHEQAYPANPVDARNELDPGGQYQWRRGAEAHLFNPTTIHRLQRAVRQNDYDTFKQYSRAVDDQARQQFTIRGLLRFVQDRTPIPIDEVEPAADIMKRFCTGAMSFGSISAEAHETIAVAMNRFGGKSNSGEGGEDPARFTPDANGDLRRSAIKQVASGRFGVTSWYLVNADELQIKISQGAKPGEGGQLPGHKVDRNIARVRYSTPGVGLISPPPHHDIYSIEDLAQLIHDLKNSNPEADISVKLVSVTGVGTIAAGVSKGHAETVLIVGHDGGTGASPQTSIKHAGVPWEIGLAETQQALVLNDLRGRIRVHVDGQLKTGRDVVIGAMLGGEEFGFGTTALVALGCIMMRVCHLNTCPVGVATQDPRLREKFSGKPEHVVHFFEFVAREVREIMAELGIRRLEDLVGRADLLEPDPEVQPWKLPDGLDWSSILHMPDAPEEYSRRRVRGQDHGLDHALDHRLIELCRPAIDKMQPVEHSLPIRNVNRTVGTMLGAAVSKRHGLEGLPDNTIRLKLTGSAGQSFGAFVPHGITLTLIGDSQDYTGKGLSGGRLIVYPHPGSTFDASENIVIGNVALYGATGGEAYFHGRAGERFGVRNSGAHAVVEGVGDHGCEYMTGGRVVILGPVGRNFAAGMSGGIAYVLDPDDHLSGLYNPGMVDLDRVDSDDSERELRGLIQAHFRHTRSRRAENVLEKWQDMLPRFVKVMPRDYKRVLKGIEFSREDY
ncbi:MAG: glutamate synthase large subunit [Deltaproteobacteria bacterium]|nr:glutamate synthase large subunit [Deltaproteobacteria bacterium]